MISVKKDFDEIPECLKSEKVKQAISDVIKDPSNYVSNIIRNNELYLALKNIYKGKCAFCESKFMEGDVDNDLLHISHYRPRPQYYWLSYEWSNLLLCCEDCQIAKRRGFPLLYEGARLNAMPDSKSFHWRLDSTDLRNEYPLLLNPEIDMPEDEFTFSPDGKIHSITNNNSRADSTIELCNLNRTNLVSQRQKVIRNFYNSFKSATKLVRSRIFGNHTQQEKENILKKNYEDVFNKLQLGISKNKEFSLLHIKMLEEFDSFFTDLFSNDLDKSIIKLAFELIINETSVDFKSLYQNKNQIDLGITQNSDSVELISNTTIDKVYIQNFLSLQEIDKFNNLKDKKEIYFLGENGDGKTLLLQGILCSVQQGFILKNTDFEDTGKILKYLTDGKATFKAVDSNENEYSKFHSRAFNFIVAYGVNRNKADSDQKDPYGFLTLFYDDKYLYNPVKWLQKLNYQELEREKNKNSEQPLINLESAKRMLSNILGEERELEINVSSKEVTFLERGTLVYFEQLSEGYKSVIVWVCDLLSRLAENQPKVTDTKEYKGIVLVDEIDLHLHPKWAYSIVKKLRVWFPTIQFFFTTHSPIVILGASDDAVFYKVYKEDGVTKISEPVTDISEYVANSLITSPLFDLETMATRSFNKKKLENLSSDDFIYKQIHKAIATRMKENPSIMNEEEIQKWVKEELDKLENVK